MHKFVIHGTRGSIPASGAEFLKYGGHTTCFSFETEEGLIIIDAGTGILSVSRNVMARHNLPQATLLFTHLHMDHIVGLPGFEPLYRKGVQLQILADPYRQEDWRAAVKTFVSKPFWPIGIEEFPSDVSLNDLPADRKNMDIYGVKISWCQVPHPQQSLAYRLDTPKGAVVIATDIEQENPNIDGSFMSMCSDADFLIYDAQYTPSEYKSRKGWGHGTWRHGVELAKKARVKELILTHHDPDRSDNEIDQIVSEARALFPRCCGAMEDMVLM